MRTLESTPPLTDEDRRLVGRASEVLRGLLDDLRPMLRRLAGDVDTSRKGDGSPVTTADLESDRHLRRGVLESFPDHEVITEEGETTWHETTWTWVVDPIDGTSNYTAGVPYWCVSVALCRDGRPVLAVVDAPSLDRRYGATLGGGATVEHLGAVRSLHVAAPVDFRSGHNAHVPVGISAGTIRRASRGVRLNPRILGAHALDLAQVAAGALVGAWSRQPKVWDVAAGSLLVQEAGGAVLQDGRGLLPLRPGIDLARAPAGFFAGPDEAWVRDVHAQLTS